MMQAGLLKIPSGDSYFARIFSESGDAFQIDLLRAAVLLCTQRRVAVDVGAHVGSWSRYLARQFRAVWAFEPHPENFACLRENTAELGVVCMNAALGNTKGEVALARHGDNSGCWRVASGAGVAMRRLDDFRLDGVDLIKLDVEGYEGAVLLGGLRTLQACKPVVVFEDNGLGAKLYRTDWIDPRPVLAAAGYRHVARIRKDEIWSAT